MSSDTLQGASVLTLAKSKVSSLMESFCALDASSQLMQSTVHALTREVVAAAQDHGPSLTCATLIPILRGALPMYVGAQSSLLSSTCVLVRCFKSKGTQNVAVEWLGRKPFPRQEDESGPLVLLDTVIATGDTIKQVCDELLAMPGCTQRSVIIMSCYAAPAALQRLAMHPVVKYIFVAAEAEKSDDYGYLVPYTNGDIGDKIYGAKPEDQTDVDASDLFVAEGGNLIAVSNGVTTMPSSLHENWRLIADGTTLEREIRFKTFKAAWNFMTDIATEASKHKHHPDWNNVYNKVTIRWTTHKPKGLTAKDMEMAMISDGRAKAHGSLE